MNKVVEEGTGRRAMLDGIKVAGKTGTTNAYRDAWFVGYTGNYVGGVWFGNDDYQPTNQMTGGSLPAMTWQQIMAVCAPGHRAASRSRARPGTKPPPARAPWPTPQGRTPDVAARPSVVLTRRGADVLVRLERLMDDATRALADQRPRPSKAADAQGAAPLRRRARCRGRPTDRRPHGPRQLKPAGD